MVDKVHYQAAAAEVADGNIDQALWIKVNSDMPEATGIAKQAKYIQLRAQELSIENAKGHAKGLWSRIWPWLLYVLASYVAAVILGLSLPGRIGDESSAILMLVLLAIPFIRMALRRLT